MGEEGAGSQADEAAVLARANFERVVGEVLLFLGGIPPYDELFLEQLPERIVRPLALKQFEIVRSGEGIMVGYRSWAMVTDELAARLEAADGVVELGRDDWNCGAKRVVVDEVGLMAKDGGA